MLRRLDNKVMRGFPLQIQCKCPHLTHTKAELSNGMMRLMFNTCAFRAANKGRQRLPPTHLLDGWVPLTSSARDESPQDRRGKAHSSKGDAWKSRQTKLRYIPRFKCLVNRIYLATCLEGNYILIGKKKFGCSKKNEGRGKSRVLKTPKEDK